MTKEVMVTLSGLQLGDSGEDTVETVHIGEYYEKNGVHYLFFDELLEGHKTPIRNMLKLRNEKLEVRKRGPVSAELVFEEGEVTESAYNIPYGSFLVGVHTKGVCLGVEEEKIEMTASYELMVNGAHCSDCDIKVTVEPRHSYRLCKETEEAPGNIDTKDALIDKDEFKETIKYLDRIKEEAMTFVEEYVQHVSGSRKMDPREFKRRYTYSPLIYFHQELGI